MRTIFNWVGGSFFRSIGRIIAYIVIGGLIAMLINYNDIKIPNVFEYTAEADIKMISSPEWSKDLPSLQQTLMKDCTGANTCNTEIGMTQYTEAYEDGETRRFVLNSSTINIASNGILVMNNSGRLKSGYIYSINYYLCSQGSLNPSGSSFYISAIDYNNPGVKHNTYELFSSSFVNGYPFGTNGQYFNYCRKFESLIVPNDNLNWIGIRLKSMSGVDYLSTISYEIEELGIYSAEVESIVTRAVTNATSSLVTSSQLNEATSQIEEAQQTTTDSINNNLGNACSNEFTNNFSSSYMTTYSNGNLISNLSNAYYSYITYNSGTTLITKMNNNLGNKLYFSFSSIPSDTFLSVVVFGSNNQYQEFNGTTGNSNLSFNIPSNIGTISSVQFRFNRKNNARTESGINFNKPMISFTTSSWCEYGTYTSKLDDTNNSINNINDTLNDDDTSQSSSDAEDFFNNTTISSGDSLTSIVSSPLYVINNLVTGSSSDLCVTLKSKNICLPSGDIIWGKTQRSGINWFGTSDDISSGINAFKVFFNLVVGGYLCYRIVIGLILCIDRILTPTHTEIEVMKL